MAAFLFDIEQKFAVYHGFLSVPDGEIEVDTG
jgi:hypothetical protein